MSENKISDIFKSYIKSYGKFYILSLILLVVLSLVGYLYNTSKAYINQNILYGFGLCVFIAILFFIIDFSKYRKKVNNLARYMYNIDDFVNECNSSDVIHVDILYKMISNLNIQNKKIMQKNNKDMKDMLDYYTMWVHQIKTPIAATKLMIANSKQDMSNIATQVFNIDHYVDMVLAYLRLDSQNSDLYIAKYNIHDIIEKATKKYAPLFIQSKVKLTYKRIDKDIITDEKWFRYVLEQILSNAIKYTQKANTNNGEIKIYLEGMDVLVIEDNGIGIMENDLPLIYEKGYTGFNGRVDEKASGLGLYLAKQTLEMLSHDINITSKVDVGTKVFISTKKQDLLIE